MCKNELDLVKVIDITCMDSILSDIKNCVMYAPWIKSYDAGNRRSKHLYEYRNINKLHNYVDSNYDSFVTFSEDDVREKLNDVELRYYIGFYFEQKNKNLGVSLLQESLEMLTGMFVLFMIGLVIL